MDNSPFKITVLKKILTQKLTRKNKEWLVIDMITKHDENQVTTNQI